MDVPRVHDRSADCLYFGRLDGRAKSGVSRADARIGLIAKSRIWIDQIAKPAR